MFHSEQKEHRPNQIEKLSREKQYAYRRSRGEPFARQGDSKVPNEPRPR